MFLQLEQIEKSFDGQPVLRGVSLAVAEGEILVLLGPSGCGKTTLLRIIAGLEVPDNGRLLLHSQDMSHTPIHQRDFGFVFQDYALFPHKNLQENVAFGLQMQQWDKSRLNERVSQVLALVGLVGFETRPIHELSGGEQQRVALARSLAPAPRLLLLDEPLGALDRALRERLMLELRRILKTAGAIGQQSEGMTAIYVTHDQAEAFAIADRVAVMNQGRIEQLATPQELYQRPASPLVARFLGMENVLEGKVVGLNPLCVETEIGGLEIGRLAVGTPRDWEIGDSVSLLVRPEAAQLELGPVNVVNGVVEEISFRGRYQIATLLISNSPSLPISLKFEFDTTTPFPPPGQPIQLSLAQEAILPLERR
jgi:ABC-type Fe3+/spermidine/putrescine transport system ATPase subunit